MGKPAVQLAFNLAVAPGAQRIAGVDEAGRGPLAGPVVVAAVVFAPARTPINGLADSKQLTAATPRGAATTASSSAHWRWHVVSIEVEVIDRINILQATLVGMRQAVEGVMHAARRMPAASTATSCRTACPARPRPGSAATRRDRSIMAASILAKVSRDRAMLALHAAMAAISLRPAQGLLDPGAPGCTRAHGPCPQHRRSFAPVRAAEAQRNVNLSE